MTYIQISPGKTKLIVGVLAFAGLFANVSEVPAQQAKKQLAKPTELPLWQGAPPDGGEGKAGTEHDTTTPRDERIGGRPLIRLTDVALPTLTFFPPSEQRIRQNDSNGLHPALVVFPGGGYTVLAYDLEGTEVCDWATGLGMACVLVKYRVPSSGPYPKVSAALQDAQRALAIVHERAREWGLDPARIGVVGFSAGAHLAVALTSTDKLVYPRSDGDTGAVLRPAFVMLIYPAYLTKDTDVDKLKSELAPGPDAAPTFLVQAEDDPVHAENAIAYAEALKRQKVPVELHIYANGGHGYGMRETDLPVTHWATHAATWLRTIAVLAKPE